MKVIYTIASFIFFNCFTASAQSFDWINHHAVNYNMNPEMPRHTSCISANGNVYSARMVNFTQYFGNIFGTSSIDCYTTSGQLQWSFAFGQKTVIHQMTADANGNVLVGGEYLETIVLNGNDSLTNNGTALTTNVFLFSLDASGVLRWKRNLSLTSNNITGIQAMGCDNQNNFWYVGDDFFNMTINRVDNNGLEVQTIVVQDVRTVGGICFDATNNIFVSGSTEIGMMSIGNFSATVPEQYMMFVAYVENAGNAVWIELAHDVTFQSPVCVADGAGGAYVAGTLMDSTSFGNVSFDGPQWVYDVFLTRTDAAGNFSWGIEVPQQATLTGDFHRGANNFIAADGAGNVYMMGITRGIVDWGNGVVSGSTAVPTPARQLSIIGFDSNGSAINHLDGGKSDFDQAYSIHFMATGEGYFSGAVIDTAVFGTTVVNSGGDLAYVIGRINTTVTSTVAVPYETGFSVYPVPARDQLYVDLLLNNAIGKDYAADIYNLEGRLLFEARIDFINGKAGIDINSLAPGNYFIRLNGGMQRMFTVVR